MTFEEWFAEEMEKGSLLPYHDCKEAYEAGWDACRDKWGGMDYKETVEYERSSV